MVELLATTFRGCFREDDGSNSVFQARTQTCMAEPLITELEVRRAPDCLNPYEGAPVHAQMFNFSLQTVQIAAGCGPTPRKIPLTKILCCITRPRCFGMHFYEKYFLSNNHETSYF